MKRALVSALALLTASPALAHELWLEPDPAGVKAVYGHAGEGGPADRPRLFEVKALAPGGGAVSLLDAVKPGYDTMPPLALPAAAQASRVVAARYDGGFWVKTAMGSRNTNRLNLPDALESRWSLKFAKLVLPGEQALGGALGHRLEIVPLADPYRLKAGEPLKVRVDLDGKPLAGATLSVGEPKSEPAAKVEADGAGIAQIPARSGVVLLSVSRKVPGSAPQLAAEDALAATLVYGR
jgi:nickel transport protein